jgi:uncharacterized protein (TIGR00255 family)
MTGFATKTLLLTTKEGNKSNVTISVKALNSRFFEANCRLPYALSHLETKLIKLFKQHFYRGNISCTIHMSNPTLLSGAVEPEIGMVKGYLKAIAQIKEVAQLPQEIELKQIITLPNIFYSEEKELDSATQTILLETVSSLIETVTQERIREGVELAADIRQRIAIMDQQMSKIELASSVMIQAQKEKVTTAVHTLQGDESALAEARKTALFTLLDKIDIHEEITRFKMHLQNLLIQLDSSEKEKGKRLDFTLQELSREINTISAKCSDAAIGSYAINIKVEIEKMREQVQNIV